MKIRYFFGLALLVVINCFDAYSQENDSTKMKKKTGFNLGLLPSVLFNSDLGFQYGALGNLYQYGDGSTYPEYRWSVYAEVARTTKGGGINQINFDSKYLLPFGLRLTADLSFLTQQALDFYGFNGYESRYNSSWENSASGSYISRMFYRLERQMLRAEASFQRQIGSSPFHWVAGVTFLKTEISDVDLVALNKGLSGDELLPDTISLFSLYKTWGLLPEKQWNGGRHLLLKTGLVYDSRDNEPNPMKGLWAEAVVAIAPATLASERWAKMSVILRQYFTLITNKLSFVYRAGYQGTLWGSVPWYQQSYMINSLTRSTTVDGLGGGKSLRGILRNRVVGDAVLYINAEFRWKVLHTYWKRQNFYLAISSFADVGRVVKAHPVDLTLVPVDKSAFFDQLSDSWHPAIGGGLHIAMNENFVLAVDYGRALDNRDGQSGLYIGLNWLF